MWHFKVRRVFSLKRDQKRSSAQVRVKSFLNYISVAKVLQQWTICNEKDFVDDSELKEQFLRFLVQYGHEYTEFKGCKAVLSNLPSKNTPFVRKKKLQGPSAMKLEDFDPSEIARYFVNQVVVTMSQSDYLDGTSLVQWHSTERIVETELAKIGQSPKGSQFAFSHGLDKWHYLVS
jgi:hypothetical protein